MPGTCVFVHAHPDDEALLTSGTMARMVARGWRVVLVMATCGEHGLAAENHGATTLGTIRANELRNSADVLGIARTHFLGYGDSGIDGRAGRRAGDPPAFASADVADAADRLVAILAEEDAGVVVGYDAAGGYGHPDHVQVHRVTAHAARRAGTPIYLEATVDRDALLRVLRVPAAVGLLPRGLDPAAFARAFTPAAQITHRIDVRGFCAAKRASMAAHVSQAGGGDRVRTLAALLRLPRPVFRLALGTEWFARRDPPPRTGARR